MALIPEIVYDFRVPIDTASPMLESVIKKNTATGAATTLDCTIYTVPSGRLLILSNANINVIAGAAQLPIWTQLYIQRGGEVNAVAEEHLNKTASIRRQTLNWSGELWLHPGWEVHAFCTFDAGGVANNINGFLCGMLIPRANAS